MPDAYLNVRLDPSNPGQFFACCGLFELISMEEPGLLSDFDLDSGRPRVSTFCIRTGRGPELLSMVLRRLRDAAIAFPDTHIEPPVRPATIAYDNCVLTIDWWLDEFREKPTSLKCWAGQVTTLRLLTELLPLLDVDSTPEDVFERSVSNNSLFGVDPRSAWNTLDLGFSPNEHQIASTIYPAVEILAAIGLQYFRPDFSKRSAVRYSLWRDRLPAVIARLVFSAPWDGMPRDDFAFEICKRGQSYKYFSFAKRAD